MSKTAILKEKLAAVAELTPDWSVHWQHYKGGIYKVTNFVVDTDDGEIRVVYARVDGPGFDAREEMGIMFARPLREWFEAPTDEDGVTYDCPRFVPVQKVVRWEPL